MRLTVLFFAGACLLSVALAFPYPEEKLVENPGIPTTLLEEDQIAQLEDLSPLAREKRHKKKVVVVNQYYSGGGYGGGGGGGWGGGHYGGGPSYGSYGGYQGGYQGGHHSGYGGGYKKKKFG